MAVSLQASAGIVIPQGRKASRNTAALLLSGAAHLAILVVIVRFGFLAPPPEVETEVPPITLTPVQIQPKQTPKPPPPDQTVHVRPPLQTPYDAPVKIDVVPNPDPPRTEPTVLVLPTEPPAPPSTGPAPSPPAPPPAPPRPSVIASPTWLRQPSAAQTASVYPGRAAEAGLGGRATLNCLVLASGAVEDCQVSSETPRGEGFGPAAQKLARFFVLKPRTEDGKVVEGARVNIPLTFTPPAE